MARVPPRMETPESRQTGLEAREETGVALFIIQASTPPRADGGESRSLDLKHVDPRRPRAAHEGRGISEARQIECSTAFFFPASSKRRCSACCVRSISKWFSGMGQEAISVGCTAAMEPDEFILPMHRNLGVFTTRDIALETLFAQFKARPRASRKATTAASTSAAWPITSWDDRHLGPQLGIADGIALASKLRKTARPPWSSPEMAPRAKATSHEALNVATVWQLPVLFCIESNHWGLSTPSRDQFRCASSSTKRPDTASRGRTPPRQRQRHPRRLRHRPKLPLRCARTPPHPHRVRHLPASGARRGQRNEVLPRRPHRGLGKERPCRPVRGLPDRKAPSMMTVWRP